MVQNTAILIKEYSRTNHRGQSRHTRYEAGYIAAFTSLYKVDQKSVAHSSGSIYKYLEKSQEKLRREQRKLSRKKKDSKNKQKQRKRVARVHEKIVNQRNDFIHKITTKLVSENQVIAVEDLNIKGLLKNHKLARAISSVSWSKFFDTLEYKAEWYGRKVIKVPTMYPSSQTCSKCGYKNPLVKNLSVREWECPCCHAKHDRDLNASVNILNKGLSVA